MKIPENLNISGVNYAIILCTDRGQVDNGSNLDGLISFGNQEIRLFVGDKNKDRLQTVFLHEMLHGIAEAYGLDCFDSEQGHKDLDILSHGLWDTFSRNNLLRSE
jgi:hypothetical protein